MRVYISGPMTGLVDLNFPAFNEAERLLREAGHEPINPARHGRGEPWQFYMRMALLDLADTEGVALLDNWRHSRGARLEYKIARELGLEVHNLRAWLL